MKSRAQEGRGNRILLGLGSNIEPEAYIAAAAVMLCRRLDVLSSSTVYRTEPLMGRRQPEYLNCVMLARSGMEPMAIKRTILESIERSLGRRRSSDKYASRTIDIDLLSCGDMRLRSRALILPDPDIVRRPFLAACVHEVMPDFDMPGYREMLLSLKSDSAGGPLRAELEITAIVRSIVHTIGAVPHSV